MSFLFQLVRLACHSVKYSRFLDCSSRLPNSGKVTYDNIVSQYVINQESTQICVSARMLLFEYLELLTCPLKISKVIFALLIISSMTISAGCDDAEVRILMSWLSNS